MKQTSNKELIKKVINEELERFEKIKSLELKKKKLTEALTILESGQQLDEISWQGIKNAVGFGGQKAADLGASAGKVVANKASAINKNIDNKVNKLGQTIGRKAAAIGDKISTGYSSVDSGLKQFSSDLGNAMTAGDIQTLEVKMEKIFTELKDIVSELNRKQVKLGLKPTSLKTILFRVMKQTPKPSPTAIAESKKKK